MCCSQCNVYLRRWKGKACQTLFEIIVVFHYFNRFFFLFIVNSVRRQTNLAAAASGSTHANVLLLPRQPQLPITAAGVCAIGLAPGVVAGFAVSTRIVVQTEHPPAATELVTASVNKNNVHFSPCRSMEPIFVCVV